MNAYQSTWAARRLQRRWRVGFLAVIVVVESTAGLTGQTLRDRSDASAPSESPRGGFGVGFAGSLPEFVVQVPDSKAEVTGEMVSKLGLSWVRDWLKDTPYEGMEAPVPSPLLPAWKTSSDLWFAGRLGFTPVGTIAGLTHGGIAGESAKKIEQALPSITNVMAELQLPGRFEPLLLGLLREKWPGVMLLTNPLPHESTFPVRKLINDVIPLPKGWDGVREGGVEAAAFRGTDAAVVLRVVSWGLMGHAGRNSSVSVNLTLKATLVNLRNGSRGKEFYAEYSGESRLFIAWGQDAGRLLREDLRRGIQSIADQIVAQAPAPAPEPTILPMRQSF